MSQRRSVRKSVSASLQIIDVMTGKALGRVGNLSADGLMLICPHAMPDQHVYQVRFPLPDSAASAAPIEVGIQCLWSEPASSEHSYWAGCQIVSISPGDRDALDSWVESTAGGG